MNRIRTNKFGSSWAFVCALLFALFAVLPGNVYGQSEDTLRIRIWGVDVVYAGHPAYNSVSVECRENCERLNRFDVLVDCGPATNALDSVAPGWWVRDAGWEHFSYELLYDSLIHIEMIADVPEIPGEPYQPYHWGEGVGLAELWFHFPRDSTTDCVFFPLKFYWFQCDDNIVETTNADTILVSKQVYDWPSVAEGYVPFPNPTGIPSYKGTPDWCLEFISDDAEVSREIEFYDGGFQIYCSDSLYFWDLGDVNLNSIPNEIADLVLFAEYLLHGPEVFTIDVEQQSERTDVNCDGETLTFRDLVYMWRIITGDALPWPKSTTDTLLPVVFTQNTGAGTVSVRSDQVSLAGVYLIFSDNVLPSVTVPYAWADYHFDIDSNVTKVLFLTELDGAIGTGPLLSVEGPGLLVEAYTADYDDSEIPTLIYIGEGDIDLAVGLVLYIFAGHPLPEPPELADADCSGYIDIDDIVWVIEYIFMGGPVPGDC